MSTILSERIQPNGKKPALSIVLVVYNLQREAPRSLASLSPGYQQNIREDDYEVIVVENGSRDRLSEADVVSKGRHFSYHYLDNAPASPAHAINFGAEKARGDIICIMIDGAHIVTPGVCHFALKAFRTFDDPVVLTRYFYLGPGNQNDSILDGYDKETEDGLLQKISWPEDGYRLFDIGIPLVPFAKRPTWFQKMFESACLFVKKSTFNQIGGCDDRFDLPGGGLLNLDIYRELADVDSTEIVQLIGEGTFHQLHGGITTNATPEVKKRNQAQYMDQYKRIRGRDYAMTQKKVYYMGHIPNLGALQLVEIF